VAITPGGPTWRGPRARASLTGPVTARAAGNSVVSSDQRGPRAAWPAADGDQGSSSFGGHRLPQEQEPGPWYNPGGRGGAFGGGWADGILTVRERHIMTRRGTVRNPMGGGSSLPSADLCGPPPPRYQMVDTTESWQIGTDGTANQDNTGQHNTVEVLGKPWKRYPLGTQDGTETMVMGPPLGSWRDYGVRGGAGMHGPEPDQYDVNVVGRPRLVVQGAPDMQPGDIRTVYGGVPHGLHSPTANSTRWTKARAASIPQMQPPRIDRPNSSKIAGQSMSQSYPPEGSPGSRATPRMANAGRRPGIGGRFLART
jgi:hypothetical protein